MATAPTSAMLTTGIHGPSHFGAFSSTTESSSTIRT